MYNNNGKLIPNCFANIALSLSVSSQALLSTQR